MATATRLEVAQLAGVSPSTVSRVVNNNGYVAEDVRQRVLKAIDTLQYVPNRIARSLRTQESLQIACITHSVTNPFYGEVVLGIEETAYQHGYTFALYNANFEKRDYQRVIAEGLHDGLIVLSPVELAQVMLLEQASFSVPTVVYWDFSGNAPVPSVSVDLRSGMKTIVNHLITSGHREIVFLGHESRELTENPRFQGYCEAMKEAGIVLKDHLIQPLPKWNDTLMAGYERVKQIVRSGIAFSAIAASNDLLAIGAIRALKEEGFRVPEDISVTGIDDIDLASLVTPSLTTIHIPKRQIGNMLFHLLLAQIKNEQQVVPVKLPFELMIRESVQPCTI